MDDLLKAKDVAQMLAVAPSTVYDLTRRGVLPCVVVSRGASRACRRWRRADIAALIEAGLQEKAS